MTEPQGVLAGKRIRLTRPNARRRRDKLRARSSFAISWAEAGTEGGL